jgi:hypothetical protein
MSTSGWKVGKKPVVDAIEGVGIAVLEALALGYRRVIVRRRKDGGFKVKAKKRGKQ